MPIPMIVRIQMNRQLRKSNKKLLGVVKPKKTHEVIYRKYLISEISDFNDRMIRELQPVLEAFEHQFAQDAMLPEHSNSSVEEIYTIVMMRDGYAETLEEVFNNLRNLLLTAKATHEAVTANHMKNLNRSNKEKFYSEMRKAVGVNMQNVIAEEGIDNAITTSIKENVSLISSMSEEQLARVEKLVYRNVSQGTSAKSMIDEIKSIKKLSTSRAKLIARDQTAKVNAILTRKRQQNLGVTEYIWRTSQDARVRDSHKANNGKKFRWDSPPKETGHPGHDIQCRCIAQAVINL